MNRISIDENLSDALSPQLADLTHPTTERGIAFGVDIVIDTAVQDFVLHCS
jgi:hypothetical protein